MKRTSTKAAVLVVALAGALAGAATAFGDDVLDTDKPAPVTAAEHYDEDLTLEEISIASQGKPGEAAPPCPEASVVTKLKAAGLAVGPCDPVPENGEAIILPTEAEEEAMAAEAADDETACPVTFLRTTSPKAVNRVEAPCGPGAEITNVAPFMNAKGVGCATVSYVVAAGAPAKTSSVCADDPADPSKPDVMTGGK